MGSFSSKQGLSSCNPCASARASPADFLQAPDQLQLLVPSREQQAEAIEILQFQQHAALSGGGLAAQRGAGERSSRVGLRWGPSYGGASNSFAPAVAATFNDDDPMADGPSPVNNEPEPHLSSAPAAEANATLSLTARVEYASLRAGAAQTVFGLLTVRAAEHANLTARAVEHAQNGATISETAERQPMDIVCILDVSGSMRGNKISQVKDAVRFIIDQCRETDRLSIVTFESRAQRVTRMCKMDTAGRDLSRAAVVQLPAGGGTNIAAGLDMGCSVMEQRRQRNTVSAMLLLTDGQDRSSAGQIPALIARARQANCGLYAFGFGADHDARMLGDISEQAYTPFTFVENAEDIREAFAGTVGGLASMAARDVSLSLKCLQTQLKAVHTGFAVQRAGDAEATITIPDMFAGERRDILVELSVPATAACSQAAILEASLRYSDLATNSSLVQTPVTQMLAEYDDEPQPEQEPDEEVTTQRERVEVTASLQQAMERCDAGQFQEAQQLLTSTSARLASSKKKSAEAVAMNSVLRQELADAQSSMVSSSLWETGGRAECRDKKQMHTMQRTTNTYCGRDVGTSSVSSSGTKMSKALYAVPTQSSWISSSKRGF